MRLGLAVPAVTSCCYYQLLSQEQCPVTARSVFSIFQVIPLQPGFQVAIRLQGGLGLDISADMDVNIWEQELKTSINARSVGRKLLGSGDAGYPVGPAQGMFHLRLAFHSLLLFCLVQPFLVDMLGRDLVGSGYTLLFHGQT